MTHNLEALARSLVASPRWRWMPGMRAFLPAMGEMRGLAYRVPEGPTLIEAAPNDGWWPDLTDPATLGCLLALVREAWGRPAIVVVPGLSPDPAGHRWYIQDNPPNTASGYEPTLRTDGTFSALSASAEVSAPTEASALVAALLAAP